MRLPMQSEIKREIRSKDHSIFVTIFSALMVMLVIVVMLMAAAIAISGVTLQLDENAVDILDKQVENRANYIQDQFQQAQELTELSGYIDEQMQQMIEDGTVSLETLDSASDQSLPLLKKAAPKMLETLRSKRITGIFIILNTHSFDGRNAGERLPCIYLRDLDPDAAPSENNADLLLERAPAELVASLGISTDKSWTPALEYQGGDEDLFYIQPFQRAYDDSDRLEESAYGRWTTVPYKLAGDDREAIAYTQPLLLDDGTIYGVLGVEMLESYLETRLPWDELQSDHHGSYFLASTGSDIRSSMFQIYVSANTGEQKQNVKNADWELTLIRNRDYWYYGTEESQQIAR